MPSTPSTPAAAAVRKRFSLSDLRAVRESGAKVAMLTCYDYTTARLMDEAQVPMILVGDSAGSVVLGYESTVPTSLRFMMEITAAVRRGAPHAFVLADMPFGSYHGSIARGVKNVCRMMQLSQADGVKLEVAASHERLVRELADAGVAVVAHMGLRPQAVGILGGYRFQGRTAHEAEEIVDLARRMERAGAAAVLLEAVPPEVSEAVVAGTRLPVIGCGAGPACHASVVVTYDLLGMTPRAPKFVTPDVRARDAVAGAIAGYVRDVASGKYPGPEHQYAMPAGAKADFAPRGAAPTGATATRPVDPTAVEQARA